MLLTCALNRNIVINLKTELMLVHPRYVRTGTPNRDEPIRLFQTPFDIDSPLELQRFEFAIEGFQRLSAVVSS